MPLYPGEQLGHYKVVSMLGRGGMGEVYLGTDTRLGRPVAIKVSSREFTDRFEREAKAISSLNHPNICTLYDVGPNYLVMELVEGESLSAIIGRGPLPLDQALQYAIQIVDALSAAHERGVIHRDLKPANIIITKNGAKVLDFGLAKLASERVPANATGDTETAVEPLTKSGSIIGTLYYMSPEQVEGNDTDERSDIFSFGVLLYEMITGQRPFTGGSQAAVLASLMKDGPPPLNQRHPSMPQTARQMAPRSLERLVRKCLEKKADDRWQSARDLKPALELIDLEAPSGASSGSSIPVQVPTRRRWLLRSAAGAGLLVLAGAAYEFRPKPQPDRRVTRFQVPLPEGALIVDLNFYIRVSPDGSRLAFTTSGEDGGIWIRDLQSVAARLLPGTAGALSPFWSPDNKFLAFGSRNKLMRIDVSGGPPQVICESRFAVGSGFWTGGGEIVFGPRPNGVMQRVKAAGGIPQPVTALLPDERGHTLPSLLPDGRHFLYLISPTDAANSAKMGIYAGSLDTRPDQQPRVKVAEAQLAATFVRSASPGGGDLFFVRDGTLMAQPFDVKALRLTGDPVPVVQKIGFGGATAHFSVTAGGVLAYRTGHGTGTRIAWVDRGGKVLNAIAEQADQLVSVSLSPDEKQVAILRGDPARGLGDIWLLDLRRNIETRLTTGQAVRFGDYGPVWSPDGRQLAYASGNGIYIKDSGGAMDGRLVKDLGHPVNVTDWTRDGRFLIYDERISENSSIREVPVMGGDSVPVTPAGMQAHRGRISSDSHWIAYDEAVADGPVYVRPYAIPGSGTAPAGPVIQISRTGGAVANWSRDGNELFFFEGDAWASAKIDHSGGGFRPEAPVQMRVQRSDLVVSGNPERFLAVQPFDPTAVTPITVVTNWEAALQGR
jgi:eukaryotic-like serine/threonine-protein kinase